MSVVYVCAVCVCVCMCAAYVGGVFGLFLVAAFMWPFSRMVRSMVQEKEARIREGMKMMGMHVRVCMCVCVCVCVSCVFVCM